MNNSSFQFCVRLYIMSCTQSLHLIWKIVVFNMFIYLNGLMWIVSLLGHLFRLTLLYGTSFYIPWLWNCVNLYITEFVTMDELAYGLVELTYLVFRTFHHNFSVTYLWWCCFVGLQVWIRERVHIMQYRLMSVRCKFVDLVTMISAELRIDMRMICPKIENDVGEKMDPITWNNNFLLFYMKPKRKDALQHMQYV